jgi:hypothetical protein
MGATYVKLGAATEGGPLAVCIVSDMVGMTPELYDSLNAAIRFPADVPEGLMSHVAAEIEGGLRIVDVWESSEHFDRFVEEKLGPALGLIEGAEAISPPQPQVAPLQNAWHG